MAEPRLKDFNVSSMLRHSGPMLILLVLAQIQLGLGNGKSDECNGQSAQKNCHGTEHQEVQGQLQQKSTELRMNSTSSKHEFVNNTRAIAEQLCNFTLYNGSPLTISSDQVAITVRRRNLSSAVYHVNCTNETCNGIAAEPIKIYTANFENNTGCIVTMEFFVDLLSVTSTENPILTNTAWLQIHPNVSSDIIERQVVMYKLPIPPTNATGVVECRMWSFVQATWSNNSCSNNYLTYNNNTNTHDLFCDCPAGIVAGFLIQNSSSAGNNTVTITGNQNTNTDTTQSSSSGNTGHSNTSPDNSTTTSSNPSSTGGSSTGGTSAGGGVTQSQDNSTTTSSNPSSSGTSSTGGTSTGGGGTSSGGNTAQSQASQSSAPVETLRVTLISKTSCQHVTSLDQVQLHKDIVKSIASLLGIQESSIVNVSVTCGSVIINFAILENNTSTPVNETHLKLQQLITTGDAVVTLSDGTRLRANEGSLRLNNDPERSYQSLLTPSPTRRELPPLVTSWKPMILGIGISLGVIIFAVCFCYCLQSVYLYRKKYTEYNSDRVKVEKPKLTDLAEVDSAKPPSQFDMTRTSLARPNENALTKYDWTRTTYNTGMNMSVQNPKEQGCRLIIDESDSDEGVIVYDNEGFDDTASTTTDTMDKTIDEIMDDEIRPKSRQSRPPTAALRVGDEARPSSSRSQFQSQEIRVKSMSSLSSETRPKSRSSREDNIRTPTDIRLTSSKSRPRTAHTSTGETRPVSARGKGTESRPATARSQTNNSESRPISARRPRCAAERIKAREEAARLEQEANARRPKSSQSRPRTATSRARTPNGRQSRADSSPSPLPPDKVVGIVNPPVPEALLPKAPKNVSSSMTDIKKPEKPKSATSRKRDEHIDYRPSSSTSQKLTPFRFALDDDDEDEARVSTAKSRPRSGIRLDVAAAETGFIHPHSPLPSRRNDDLKLAIDDIMSDQPVSRPGTGRLSVQDMYRKRPSIGGVSSAGVVLRDNTSESEL